MTKSYNYILTINNPDEFVQDFVERLKTLEVVSAIA